jgi:DNA-binding response OmpR family regulator
MMINFDTPPLILFADDDPATLDIFREYIFSFGWSGEYVESARGIIDAINRHDAIGRPFDALVCDVNFLDEHPNEGPRISGVAAARAIRENHADLPIVFVTAYSSYFMKDEVVQVGGEMFQKPVNFESLFERVAYLIRWNQSAAPPAAGIEDRRRASINRTGHRRRTTDKPIEVPKILSTANAEIRDEQRARGEGH